MLTKFGFLVIAQFKRFTTALRLTGIVVILTIVVISFLIMAPPTIFWSFAMVFFLNTFLVGSSCSVAAADAETNSLSARCRRRIGLIWRNLRRRYGDWLIASFNFRNFTEQQNVSKKYSHAHKHTEMHSQH